MKKTIVISIAFILIILLAVGLVFSFTSGLTDAMDTFFNAAVEKNTVQIEQILSTGFLENTSPDELFVWLDARGLNNIREQKWNSREVKGKVGNLSGSVVNASGFAVPLEVVFVKENGKWKIHSIKSPQPGLNGILLPEEDEMARLALETTNRFVVSLNHGSMEYFREGISNIWSEEFSTEQLNYAYEVFFEIAPYLKPALDTEPTILESHYNERDHVLTILGHHPLEEQHLQFEQNYIKENGEWKLLGLHVSVE